MPSVSPRVAVDLVADVLARDGLVWVREGSDSMAPLIARGDALRLAPCAPARLRPGMLVAVRREDRLVVHRVVARRDDAIVTRGDALPTADPPVDAVQVVGRVTALRTPQGRLVELATPPWPALDRLLAALAVAGAPVRPLLRVALHGLARLRR